MAVREQVTQGNLIVARVPASIGTSTTTTTQIIDTKDADLGVTFFLYATAYTDGTFKLIVEESDASNLAGSNVVGVEKLVRVAGKDAYTDGIAAATAVNTAMSKLGVHSTKRYVRASVVSTSVSTGATIGVACLLNGEFVPE
jgi:hypothetical protein